MEPTFGLLPLPGEGIRWKRRGWVVFQFEVILSPEGRWTYYSGLFLGRARRQHPTERPGRL